MKTKVFKASEKEQNEIPVKEFKESNDIVIVSEIHFFDRIDGKETHILFYYI